ncbi:MAG: hypothetical protein ACOYLV_15780 [Rubrivivax sp.]
MTLHTDTRCATIVRKALAVVAPQFRLSLHHGAHGVAHWSRVWFHGRALAASLDINPAVLAWFAFLHDSQRHNEHCDPQHGARAAHFAVHLRRAGTITELSCQEFEHLCEAMQLHSDGHTEAEPALRACWDADRLDLSRVGITPEPRYLCTEHGRREETLRVAVRMGRGMGEARAAASRLKVGQKLHLP